MVPIPELFRSVWHALVLIRIAMLKAVAATVAIVFAGDAVALYHYRPTHGLAVTIGVLAASVLLVLELMLFARLWRLRHLTAGG